MYAFAWSSPKCLQSRLVIVHMSRSVLKRLLSIESTKTHTIYIRLLFVQYIFDVFSIAIDRFVKTLKVSGDQRVPKRRDIRPLCR